MVALTICAAVLPAAIVYVGKLIIDAVVIAAKTRLAQDSSRALGLVGTEFGLMAASTLINRTLGLSRELMRAKFLLYAAQFTM